MSNRHLKILYLAAEVVPFAKTGGLADVAGSLPKAIHALGHDIRVAMPRYGRIDPGKFGLRKALGSFPVPLDENSDHAEIYEGRIGEAVPIYFVENQRLYDREGIYMYPDDAERFIFYCRAAIEMLRQMDWQPDIIHCNDWHTAIVPNWFKTLYKTDPFFTHTATVYTIHNLAYQGIFGHRVLEIAGVDEFGFLAHPDTSDLNQVVDLMARGILFADVISTVSETYAQEILTPEFGERLDPLLRDRRHRLFGMLNGIDTETMDPSKDPHLAQTFDAASLDRRVANKLALQREAHLEENPDTPLLGAISRLTDQKGFDLLSAAIEPMVRFLGAQFVLLGTGDQHYHEMFQQLAQRFPGRVSAFLTFNAALAQRIYAGTDMFLMPSRFEPCGLGQMMAMRYGSVPVVRETGGLADTVNDYDARSGVGNGFTFKDYEPLALYTAIARAVETYRHPDVWRRIQLTGMNADFSWDASARKYIDLYERGLAVIGGEHKLEEYDLSRPAPDSQGS
ncbi:MAG: glycogen synthase [Chloroflexi bacterium]|nr:glycogen synthase [Chloroflexota bacterium]